MIREHEMEFEEQKKLLLQLMNRMDCETLFATYNPRLDELHVLTGSNNCTNQFECECDDCLASR